MRRMTTGVTDPSRIGTVKLPDGRQLAWAEWGPTSGAAVLFCPGAGNSRSLGFGADALDRLHIRLISIDRPGLGASTPAPERTLSDWASDIAHLARARQLDRLAVVGHSQGAPFALACAAAEVAAAAAIVAGTDELAHPALRGMLPPEVAKLVELSTADPARAEAFFAGMNAGTLWNMILGMSGETDRALYTEPTFSAAYQRALSEAFSQGSAGYARDTVLAMRPWPFDPAAIRVPVDLWYGALDTSTVHSPDHGATLARRLPSARRHLLPQEGGGVLWTRAEEILASLLARIEEPAR